MTTKSEPTKDSLLCCTPVPADQNANLLRPLFFGRLFRIVAGAITIWLVARAGIDGLGMFGFWALMWLGVSFVLSGVMAMPGCEVMALPNLFLPVSKRLYMLCPLWTPIDRIERAWRDRQAAPPPDGTGT